MSAFAFAAVDDFNFICGFRYVSKLQIKLEIDTFASFAGNAIYKLFCV